MKKKIKKKFYLNKFRLEIKKKMIKIFLLVLALLSHSLASSRKTSIRNEYEIIDLNEEAERRDVQFGFSCKDPRDHELMKKLTEYTR